MILMCTLNLSPYHFQIASIFPLHKTFHHKLLLTHNEQCGESGSIYSFLMIQTALNNTTGTESIKQTRNTTFLVISTRTLFAAVTREQEGCTLQNQGNIKCSLGSRILFLVKSQFLKYYSKKAGGDKEKIWLWKEGIGELPSPRYKFLRVLSSENIDKVIKYLKVISKC